MDIRQIPAGKNPPEEINVVIEIPMNAHPIKYEVDKDSGALYVDRFIQTPMFYPCNYGFIPNTLSKDGDPSDVLVMTSYPLIQGCVIRVRPIGALIMEDESGEDEKIIAVPINKIDPEYNKIQDIDDLSDLFKAKISHFFEHYKDLEPNKWVKLSGWKDKKTAEALILAAINNYKI